MADQVTISTFLELRDNMSPGLMRVHAHLTRLLATTNQLTSAMRRLGAESRRLGGSLSAADASAHRTHTSVARLSRDMLTATLRARTLAAAMRSIPAAAPAAPMPPGHGPTTQPSRRGIFRELVVADLLATGIKKVASFAIDTTTDIVKKAIDVNLEYEKSISAISSAMYTMDVSPSMQVAETYSKEVVDILRKYAAKLPGEAADYVEVFQRTIPAAMQSGMKDSKKYAEFVSKYTAVAIQRGIGAKVAATNLQLLLQGTARAGTKMAQVLSAYTGKTINDINKMTREARFDLYQKAVEDAAAGMGAAASKADAIFGELKTHVEDIYRIGGGPLFEAAKLSAENLNKWFEENKKSVEDLAKTIATSLGDALTGAVSIASQLVLKLQAATKSLAKTPQERLKEIERPAYAKLQSYIPGLGLYNIAQEEGEIDRINKETEKSMAATQRFVATSALYKPRERSLGYGIKAKDPLYKMVMSAESLIKDRMFDDTGKILKLAFADYMEYRGVSEQRTQRVWEELTAKGIVKSDKTEVPLSAPRGAPSVRPEQTFDFRHSRFDIKQEFAEGFDPDRIAVAFANDLGRLGDMKLQASYGLAGGVR